MTIEDFALAAALTTMTVWLAGQYVARFRQQEHERWRAEVADERARILNRKEKTDV